MDRAEHFGQGGRDETWVSSCYRLANIDYDELTQEISFVSRLTPKVNDKHVVLGVIGWKPKDFANQMNLQLSNGWGIVRTIADMCLQHEEGKYVLVKDPNKSILRLYEVPAGGLDDEEDGLEPDTAPAEEE